MKNLAESNGTHGSDGSLECWCCGRIEASDRMVRLGNHPEVTICVGCAHLASKSAWEIEDRARAGLAVRAREQFRAARRFVIDHGLHDYPVVGPVLRWIGARTP